MVVGLGPAGPDLLTVAARQAIDRCSVRYVRTARHPAVVAVGGAESFDSIYESAQSFEEVYSRIVDLLVEAAEAKGPVLYAVPGSPLVAERTVELLLQDRRVGVELVAGLSFADLVWTRLGIDPVSAGVRLVDGRRFAVEAAGSRGPLLVAQCDRIEVLSEIKLALDPGGPAPALAPALVTVLQRLGLPGESVRMVAWDDLDRDVEPDHLTSIYIPVLAAPVAAELVRFAELVRTLRERCPWDREQTHETLTRHLLEETYEVLEAIEALGAGGPDVWGHLEEELGDLLFQVVFHSTLAAEEGQFTLADVARTVHDKLVSRHPHVFGNVEATTAGQVMRNWEQIKKAEKGHTSLMDGIAGDLPSLLYAHKVQRKAASVGLDADLPVNEALRRFEAAPATETLGEVLMAVVGMARHAGLDPEAALRGAAAVFRRRFQALEAVAERRGLELPGAGAADLDVLWRQTLDAPAPPGAGAPDIE